MKGRNNALRHEVTEHGENFANLVNLSCDVTCRANTPEHPRLKSWQNKLEFA